MKNIVDIGFALDMLSLDRISAIMALRTRMLAFSALSTGHTSHPTIFLL